MLKKMLPVFLFLSCVLTIGAAPGQGAKSHLIEPLGEGALDWKRRVLRVSGVGVPPERGSRAQRRLMAQRAALTDAYRQLAEAINGVQVFSDTQVQDFVVQSDTVRLQVSAVIRGARPVGHYRYLSDGSVEVDVELPLFGDKSIASALNMGQALADRSPLSRGGYHYQYFASLGPWPERLVQGEENASYSGLIIDASGLGVEPALGPFLVGAARRIHPDMQIGIDPNLIVREGPLHYVESIEQAQSDKQRLGANPLYIEAKAAIGHPKKTDILLDAEAVDQIIKANREARFLQELRVTLII